MTIDSLTPIFHVVSDDDIAKTQLVVEFPRASEGFEDARATTLEWHHNIPDAVTIVFDFDVLPDEHVLEDGRKVWVYRVRA
jgi:hypothetical protein